MKRFVKNIRHLILGLGFAAAAAGCGASISHHADYEHTVSFDEYQTFYVGEFDPEPPAGLDARREPPEGVVDAVHDTITAELEAKGMAAADETSADLIININGGGRSAARTVAAAGGAANPFEGSYVERYREGTLIIDIRDRENNMLVWHGWATAAVPDEGADTDTIREAVVKILSGYPPE